MSAAVGPVYAAASMHAALAAGGANTAALPVGDTHLRGLDVEHGKLQQGHVHAVPLGSRQAQSHQAHGAELELKADAWYDGAWMGGMELQEHMKVMTARVQTT